MNEIISEGYKKTKVGIIPEDWSIVRIDTVLDRVRKKVDVQTKVQYQQIGIRSHGKGLFHKKLVSGKELGNKSVFWIEEGCFIVNIVFAWEQAIGKTTENEIGMIASHRFPMYKPQVDKVDLDYLVYLFKSKRGKHLLELASPGGAGRNKTLGQKEFSELEIPLPPFREQQKIAKILTIYDEVIMKQEELIEEKKQFKKDLIKKLLHGEHTRDWNFIKLGELLEYEQPTKYLVSSTNYDDSFKTPVLTAGKTFILGYTDEKEGVFKEDLPVIIFDDFTTANKFVDFPFKAKSSAMKILKAKNKEVNIKLVYELMQSIRFLSDDHKRYWISEYQELEVKVPPLEEQERIMNILNLADEELKLLQKELNELKRQKKGLMQKLLTGKVRVKV